MMLKWFLVLLAASVWAVEGGLSPCIEIKKRREWGALKPRKVELQPLPIKTIIIAHTAGSSCDNFNYCSKYLQDMQDNHMDYKNYDDISYNFLVGGDGVIYEGRGFDKVGEHTDGHNKGVAAIAFMGVFQTKLPTAQALGSTLKFLDCAVQAGLVDPNYKLYGQRQFVKTDSPGRRLYAEVQYWPHWSADLPKWTNKLKNLTH